MGIELVRHIGWSSVSVEQPHASATCMSRALLGYGVETQRASASVRTARPLWTPKVGCSSREAV